MGELFDLIMRETGALAPAVVAVIDGIDYLYGCGELGAALDAERQEPIEARTPTVKDAARRARVRLSDGRTATLIRVGNRAKVQLESLAYLTVGLDELGVADDVPPAEVCDCCQTRRAVIRTHAVQLCALCAIDELERHEREKEDAE